MDNIVEIVIFVALMIISAIPKLLKQQKSKQYSGDDATRSHDRTTDTAEDPWSTLKSLLDKEDDRSDNTYAPSPQEAAQNYSGCESTYIDDAYHYKSTMAKRGASENGRSLVAVNAGKSTSTNTAKYTANQQYTRRQFDTLSALGGIDSNEIGNDICDSRITCDDGSDQWSPSHEVLDDIDMRKAIIYSEILNPKFDD